MKVINQSLNRFTSKTFYKNKVKLKLTQPIVSFTFDDFPKSAVENGASILDQFSSKGTFYTSLGLAGKKNHLGEMFQLNDIERLINAGHEVGCHTFTHKKPHSQSLEALEQDLITNQEELRKFYSKCKFNNFSYPYGQVNSKIKGITSKYFKTSRSIYPGIHKSEVDLNLLKANKIYSSGQSFNHIEKLLLKTKQNVGWVIFYTHDVRLKYSEFGCSPGLFKKTIELAKSLNFKILSISEAIDLIHSNSQ